MLDWEISIKELILKLEVIEKIKPNSTFLLSKQQLRYLNKELIVLSGIKSLDVLERCLK